MGVLYAKVGGAWQPVLAGGGGGGITEAEADLRYVNVAGDTMTGALSVPGISVPSSYIGFGSRFGQHINLYSTTNGMGVQNGVQYQRVASSSAYSWFTGGVHADTARDPGAGGKETMHLDVFGALITANGLEAHRNAGPAGKFIRIYDDELFAWDAGAVAPLKIQRTGGLTSCLGPLRAFNTGAQISAVTNTPGETAIIQFYTQGTAPDTTGSRSGYCGYAAGSDQLRLYNEGTGDTMVRAPGAVIMTSGTTEICRTTSNSWVVGKTANNVAVVGSYMATNGQFCGTADTDIDQLVSNAIAAAIVNGHSYFSAKDNNALRGSITRTTAGVAYNVTSDYRVKNDLGPVVEASERVRILRPRRIALKESPDDQFDAFIAHEVAEVVPAAVTGEKDAVDEDGAIVPQQLDATKLVPLLTAALQEALARIDTLEARLTALEAA